MPLSILSITKLNARTKKDQKLKGRTANVHWKPYAHLFSDDLYLGFNIETPDEVVAEWQRELDKLKDSPFYKGIEKTYISPIVHEANAYRWIHSPPDTRPRSFLTSPRLALLSTRLR